MVFGWWFQTFFHNIWDNSSHWVIFFRGVETTSHAVIYVDEIIKIPSIWCIYWGFLYGGFLSHGGTSSSSIYRWSFHEKVTILWAVPFDATSICEMLDFYPIPGQWGISKMCTDDKANCLHSFKVEYPSTRSGFFFPGHNHGHNCGLCYPVTDGSHDKVMMSLGHWAGKSTSNWLLGLSKLSQG